MSLQSQIDSSDSLHLTGEHVITEPLQIRKPFHLYGPGKILAAGNARANLIVKGEGIRIEGITLDQNNRSNGSCISIEGATNTRIRGVEFLRSQLASVWGTGLIKHLTIEGCDHYSGSYGFWLKNPSPGSRGFYCRNNTLLWPEHDVTGQGSGIGIDAPKYGFAHFEFVGNTVDGFMSSLSTNGGIGIGLARASYGTISANLATNCSKSGVHLEDGSNHVTITGTTVHRIGLQDAVSDPESGIAILKGSGCVISSCVVRNVRRASGILLRGDHTGVSKRGPAIERDNAVSQNIVAGTGHAGILISNQDGLALKDNRIRSADFEDEGFSCIDLRRINQSIEIDNRDCEITGNRVSDGGRVAAYGISVQDYLGHPGNLALTNSIRARNGIRLGTATLA